MSAWRYYVYEILRDGKPIYVGKGCGNRAGVSARVRGGSPEIVAYFRDEASALSFERERIAERLAEGAILLNILHGSSVSWHRRTDTRQMAIEVMQEIARRIGNWMRAGHLHALSLRTNMPETRLLSIYQEFGR